MLTSAIQMNSDKVFVLVSVSLYQCRPLRTALTGMCLSRPGVEQKIINNTFRNTKVQSRIKQVWFRLNYA